MRKVDLKNDWYMEWDHVLYAAGNIPCSMYDTLLRNGLMENPYYSENEKKAMKLAWKDVTFNTSFLAGEVELNMENPMLCLEMVDTLADIYLNGVMVGHTENMHRTWSFSVKDTLKHGRNELEVSIKSPLQYAEKRNRERALWGVESTYPGYQYIRKAHYMFGWDWGPCLPDMGIYRDVYLYDDSEPRVASYRMRQIHSENHVTLLIKPEYAGKLQEIADVEVSICSPQGKEIVKKISLEGEAVLEIKQPELWWPNGYGAAALYKLAVKLFDSQGRMLDCYEDRIGLRTLQVSRERDQWGREFCFQVNGVKIFSMGADYVPEDNIIPRMNRDRTTKLLKKCRQANYNCVRVWGGGFYPEDYFYKACDELGMIVWQDNMFACAVYQLDQEFENNIRVETEQNVRRLRNHPCLGLWCGNNEMKTAWESWGIPQDKDLLDDYDRMFRHVIEDAVRENDGNTFYWPSSPYSGNDMIAANDFDNGDVHYWDVWHKMAPMADAFRYYFRFCSEYGFEALPDRKTLEEVLCPEERNLFSSAMEAHHKCEDGTQKLLFYLSQCVKYPCSFSQLIYATQLLQAEAIRMNVEHMRRNRGRCMGSVYWQLNDSNPAISWSGIDYCQRLKALHYFARRFYAPILVSGIEKKGIVQLWGINETLESWGGELHWRLRNHASHVIKEGKEEFKMERCSSNLLLQLDFQEILSNRENRRKLYMEYTLGTGGSRDGLTGTLQFVPFKEFQYLKPDIRVNYSEIENEFLLRLSCNVYAKDVCISLKNTDCDFSDNWFDLHGEENIIVRIPKESCSRKLDIQKLEEEVQIMSIYDIGQEMCDV